MGFYKLGAAPGVLITGSLACLFALPAFAQLEEITVTARKVEESLQEAPVSITAFTERTLENAGIRDIRDLANLTPNLTFEAGETGRRQTPTIRGLGIIDSRGFDNNVGVFIDGFFMSGRASQNIQMLDVERVEVIRGPQSALYGRNTFAGAINYITKKPTSEFESKVEATLAEGEKYEVIGSVSGPLLGDTLSGRIALAYTDDDGMFSNTGPKDVGGGIGGYENKGVTGTLRFMPSDTIDIALSGYYSDEFAANRALHKVPNNCGELDPALSSFALPSYDKGVPAYYCGEVPSLGSQSLSMSPEAFGNEGETWRLALDMRFGLGFASLTSKTAYTDNQNLGKLDLDRTQAGEDFYGFVEKAAFDAFPLPIIPNLENVFPNNSGVAAMNTLIGSVGLDQTYFEQEFRLTSSSDGPLRWTGGVYFFDQENNDTTFLGIDATPAIQALGLPPSEIQFLLVSPGDATDGSGNTFALATPVLPNVAFKANGSDMEELILAVTGATQYAAFGSVEYDFTEKLTGTFELRYTYEERTLNNKKDIFFFTPPSEFKNDWSFWDPRAIIRYRATDDLMVYGSVAHGSRSGGLNVAISDPAAVPFDEESNWTYELGLKSTWFDNTLQFNLTGFYIDWQDAQFRQRIPSGTGFLTVTTNATGITDYGFEAELVASPFEGFNFGINYGYANPSFDDGTIADGDARLCQLLTAGNTAFPTVPVNCVSVDKDGDGTVDTVAPDISGNPPIRTAKHTASLFAEALRPITPELDVLLRFDIGYRSKWFTDNVAQQYSPSRALANLRFGVVNERYDVMVWVSNLLNEDAIESTQTFQSDLNKSVYITSGVNIDPRRVGLTARYRFGAAR